jgi:hypothetical protein
MIETIYKLYPQVVRTVGDEAFDADGNQVAYDLALVQAEINANAYKAKRATEYPAITDQLDYIYHNGIDAWKTDIIDPVKAKYPKGAV